MKDLNPIYTVKNITSNLLDIVNRSSDMTSEFKITIDDKLSTSLHEEKSDPRNAEILFKIKQLELKLLDLEKTSNIQNQPCISCQPETRDNGKHVQAKNHLHN